MKQLFIAALLCITTPTTFAMSHGGKNHQGHMQSMPIQSSFESQSQDGFTFEKFAARARIGMAPNSGIYGQIAIENGNDTLVAARTSVATRVELHEHIHDNGVMRMREVEGGLSIQAEQPLEMKPGGYHIMLIGLTGPLNDGTTVDLELEFASGKVITLQVPVVSVTKMPH